MMTEVSLLKLRSARTAAAWTESQLEVPPDHHGGVLGGGQHFLRALQGGDGQVGARVWKRRRPIRGDK